MSAGHCPLRYEDPTPLIVSRDPVRRKVDVAGLDRIGLGRSTENRMKGFVQKSLNATKTTKIL